MLELHVIRVGVLAEDLRLLLRLSIGKLLLISSLLLLLLECIGNLVDGLLQAISGILGLLLTVNVILHGI